MAMVLRGCVRRVWIAFPSTLLLATIAHGQVNRTVSTPSADADSATPAPGTRAESFTYGADVGIGESDNVTLVQTDKVSQTIAIADLPCVRPSPVGRCENSSGELQPRLNLGTTWEQTLTNTVQNRGA